MGGISDQFKVIKDNWLLILLGLGLFFFIVLLFSTFTGSMSSFSRATNSYAESSYGGGSNYADSYSAKYAPTASNNFAPEVKDRKITKTSTLSNEINRGEFQNAEDSLLGIVSSSSSYLLSQSVNKNGNGANTYSSGYYTIKVDSTKYDAVVLQLKGIGKVQSFSENAADITGAYTNTATEIEVEKSRLIRYQELYGETTQSEYKIQLINSIFDQERKIKYLEDSLKNLDSQVSYSTISVTLNEKQSNYAYITFIGFGELIRSMVNSLNTFLQLFFVLLPWAVGVGIIALIVKLVRGRRT